MQVRACIEYTPGNALLIHSCIVFNQVTTPFAAIRGTESYSLLSFLTDVMSDINSLIEHPVFDGKRLNMVFGGDYKVLVIMINSIHY